MYNKHQKHMLFCVLNMYNCDITISMCFECGIVPTCVCHVWGVIVWGLWARDVTCTTVLEQPWARGWKFCTRTGWVPRVSNGFLWVILGCHCTRGPISWACGEDWLIWHVLVRGYENMWGMSDMSVMCMRNVTNEVGLWFLYGWGVRMCRMCEWRVHWTIFHVHVEWLVHAFTVWPVESSCDSGGLGGCRMY